MVDAVISAANIEKPTRNPARGNSRGMRTALTFGAILLGLFVIWEGAKLLFNIPEYTLPHTWDIVGSLFQPARTNGPLLGEILVKAALFTWGEAALGFTLGSVVGFGLAVIFAQSGLLQRGLMPFVVASQTVPILAVAPMIVIGLSNLGTARWVSVSIIAAYLSFFPVTLNALRGLTSANPLAQELFNSYAAKRRQMLWKLNIPHALPYIFTALKVSATASIVGAIIGELPSGIQDGLGGAILNFNQYYNSAPPRLWATILIASALGILCYALVVLAERIIVRWTPPDLAQA